MALKQTVRKAKRRNKRKKRAPVRSRPRSSSSYLTPSHVFLALFTFIGMSALYMYFSHVDLNGLPPTVTKNAILIPQIATFLVLEATFGFFGYHFLKDKHIWTKMHRIALGVGFCAICLLYFACFSQEISFNGDNAEYMISAQSLVERGGAYRLYTPSETRNTLASMACRLCGTHLCHLGPGYLQNEGAGHAFWNFCVSIDFSDYLENILMAI